MFKASAGTVGLFHTTGSNFADNTEGYFVICTADSADSCVLIACFNNGAIVSKAKANTEGTVHTRTVFISKSSQSVQSQNTFHRAVHRVTKQYEP